MTFLWGNDGQAVSDRSQLEAVTLPSLKSLFAPDLEVCKRSSLSSLLSQPASPAQIPKPGGISSVAPAESDQHHYRTDTLHEASHVSPGAAASSNPGEKIVLPAPNKSFASQSSFSAPRELPSLSAGWAPGRNTLPPLRDHLPPPPPPGQCQQQQEHFQYDRCESISPTVSLPPSQRILSSSHTRNASTGPLPSMNNASRDNSGSLRPMRSKRPISVELPPIRSHRKPQSLRPCSLTADYTSRPLSPKSPCGSRHDFWRTVSSTQPDQEQWKSTSSRRCTMPQSEYHEKLKTPSMDTVIMSPMSSESSEASPPHQERMSPTSPSSASLRTSPMSKTAASTRGKKRRGNLPKHVTDVLRSWFMEHLNHPYPTEKDKHMLILQTGLTVNQISNWFINVRRRQLPAIRSQQARSIITATSESQSVPTSTAPSTCATPDTRAAYYDTFGEFSRDRRKSSNSTMISQ